MRVSESGAVRKIVDSNSSADGAKDGASEMGPGISSRICMETNGKGNESGAVKNPRGVPMKPKPSIKKIGTGGKTVGVSSSKGAKKIVRFAVPVKPTDSAESVQAGSSGSGVKTLGETTVGNVNADKPNGLFSSLFGSGPNMSVVSKELKRSVYEELGRPCPFLPDVFTPGVMKIVAGGLLASFAAVFMWKIIKRLYSGIKPDAGMSPTRKHKPSSATWKNRRLLGPRSEGNSAYVPHICPGCGLPRRSVPAKKNPEVGTLIQ